MGSEFALSKKKNWVTEFVRSFELAGISASFDDFCYEYDPLFLTLTKRERGPACVMPSFPIEPCGKNVLREIRDQRSNVRL